MPLASEQFRTSLLAFLAQHREWRRSLSFGRASTNSSDADAWRVQHITIAFHLSVKPHAPASVRRVLYNRWEAKLAQMNADAPRSAGRAVQTAGARWITMAVCHSSS